MSFKPIDAKRDEYRKYLEKSGAMELLIKVIIKLFECPDKPDNAVDFIRANMGDSMLETDTIEHLKQELEDARNEVVELKNTLETLKLENKAVPVVAESVSSLDAPLEEPNVVDKVVEKTETKLVLSETTAAVEDAEENNEVAELVQEAQEIEEENKEQPAESISDENVAAAAPVFDEKKQNDDQEKETKDSELGKDE